MKQKNGGILPDTYEIVKKNLVRKLQDLKSDRKTKTNNFFSCIYRALTYYADILES